MAVSLLVTDVITLFHHDMIQPKPGGEISTRGTMRKEEHSSDENYGSRLWRGPHGTCRL